MNAEYGVEWVSPNGAIRGTSLVAAISENEARSLIERHERRGRDGYGIGNAHLRGDLPEDHTAKYLRIPVYLGELGD